MRPIAAAAVGALISGIAVYAVNARAAQNPFTEMPAFVQTVDGRFIQVPDARTVGFAPAAAQMGFTSPGYVTTQPVVTQSAPRVVQTQAPARVYRTAAPAQERVVYRDTEDVRPAQRSWTKTAMIVGGSAASGAGVGGLVGGKKGALVGAAIGGGAASIFEAAKRR